MPALMLALSCRASTPDWLPMCLELALPLETQNDAPPMVVVPRNRIAASDRTALGIFPPTAIFVLVVENNATALREILQILFVEDAQKIMGQFEEQPTLYQGAHQRQHLFYLYWYWQSSPSAI
mmetsp:Transcript_15026/g.31865  ORF Transcript_15026/g.31865 Transcript_15026/m.31865 type:complete len:123 (+) Transcript_15026:351-719(+)